MNRCRSGFFRLLTIAFGFLGAALGAGCASQIALSSGEQSALQKSLEGQDFFLKNSYYVGPFYSYDDRLFISERAFDERVLVENLEGQAILPPDPVGILSVGTLVRIESIEFPTGGAMAVRKLKSPRHFTWVLLKTPEQPIDKPLVLVLTPAFVSREEFERALADHLVPDDPRKALADLSPEELRAIQQKTLVLGMRASSLRLARGSPDRITRKFDQGKKIELWQYGLGRVVVLQEDKVESWQDGAGSDAP